VLAFLALVAATQVADETKFRHLTCAQLVAMTLKGDGKAPFALAKRGYADRDLAIIAGLKRSNIPMDNRLMLILAMSPPVTPTGRTCLQALAKPGNHYSVRAYALRGLGRYADAQKVLIKYSGSEGRPKTTPR
jgi:hypothetical protein